MGYFLKVLLISFSIITISNVSKAEVTYSCWNCMMLDIDGEGNPGGARVDYNAASGVDLNVSAYPYPDYL